MKIGYSSFFIILIIIFFLSCTYYYPFISDDSLISLRYAQRFVEGKGLTWNDGQPVEGYSNLLWVLSISALGKLGVDLILAARILGIIFSLSTIAIILTYFKRKKIKKEYVFLGLLLLVSTPCFVVWAIGGLEQPLYILLLTCVLIEVSRIVEDQNYRRIYLLSLWLGLLAITRPDGFLFTILTSGFLIYINRKNKKNLTKITLATIVIPSLFLLGQLFFRYNFYGELVPNTALVKVKVTIHHILRGGFYNIKAFFGTLLLSGSGLYCLYILVLKKRNLFGFYLLLNIIAWISYVTLVGGDIFPAFRHYYVILIFFVFCIIYGFQYINHINFNSSKVKVVLAILLFTNIFAQAFIPDNKFAKEERWEFDGMYLGKKLKKTFPDKTLIAVTAAGCIPYSSELPSIDMLGLNDYYLARNPPSNFGNGALAHELGDANYVMKRNPDIIIISIGAELNFNIGDQLRENKIFNDNYIKVLAKENQRQYILFFNKYGNNAGIKVKNNELKIPAYLFKNNNDTLSVFKELKLLKSVKKDNLYTISIKNKFLHRKKINLNQHESNIKYKIESDSIHTSISFISKKDTLVENISLRFQN